MLNSYTDSGDNSQRCTKIEVQTLREYLIFVKKCEAILNNVSLLLWTNSLGFGIYDKNLSQGNAPINVKPAVGEAGHRAGF